MKYLDRGERIGGYKEDPDGLTKEVRVLRSAKILAH